MKAKSIFILIAAALLAAACGVSKNGADIPTETVLIGDRQFNYFTDNKAASREEAGRIFEFWAGFGDQGKDIKSWRLHDISPDNDGCHLSFDIRNRDGRRRRVELIVKKFRMTTVKEPKGKGSRDKGR